MSGAGDLQISSGGAVAVDTTSLRQAAERFHGEARRLHDLAWELRGQCARLPDAAGPWGAHLSGQVLALGERATGLADGADGLGVRLAHAAALYDLVEQRVELRQAQAAHDVQAQQAAQARIDVLEAGDPGLDKEADALVRAYYAAEAAADRAIGDAELPSKGILGGAVGAFIALGGWGRMSPGAIGPDPGPVSVRQVGATVTGRAPTGLADILSRIPSGKVAERSMVRVERYTMPDGSRRFMVYVTGTRNMKLTRTTDPSDWASNISLYAGQRSTSLAATEKALSMAGAKPGDIVDPVGHSQGAMVASRVALDGGYRTTMLVTAGSPTAAQVSADVLTVQLDHSNDAVTRLSGGGSSGQVGSERSVVISRDTDGGATATRESTAAAHNLQKYIETARLADASGDPRIADGVQRQLAELGGATSVDVFEFDAEQPAPGPPVPVPDPRTLPGVDGPFVGR